MGAKNLLQNSTKVMGGEESIFNEILWKPDDLELPILKPINNLVPTRATFFDFENNTSNYDIKRIFR